MRVLIVALLAGSALLAGCSNTRRCESNQAYEKAVTLPTPGTIPGLTVPDSPTALHIPAAPADVQPYGHKVKTEDGGTRYACLDEAPRMSTTPGDATATETVPTSPKP